MRDIGVRYALPELCRCCREGLTASFSVVFRRAVDALSVSQRFLLEHMRSAAAGT